MAKYLDYAGLDKVVSTVKELLDKKYDKAGGEIDGDVKVINNHSIKVEHPSDEYSKYVEITDEKLFIHYSDDLSHDIELKNGNADFHDNTILADSINLSSSIKLGSTTIVDITTEDIDEDAASLDMEIPTTEAVVTYVNTKIGSTFKPEVVNVLPAVGKENTFYFVPKLELKAEDESATTDNYIYALSTSSPYITSGFVNVEAHVNIPALASSWNIMHFTTASNANTQAGLRIINNATGQVGLGNSTADAAAVTVTGLKTGDNILTLSYDFKTKKAVMGVNGNKAERELTLSEIRGLQFSHRADTEYNIEKLYVAMSGAAASGTNIYDEYIYINNRWEQIGSTEVTFGLATKDKDGLMSATDKAFSDMLKTHLKENEDGHFSVETQNGNNYINLSDTDSDIKISSMDGIKVSGRDIKVTTPTVSLENKSGNSINVDLKDTLELTGNSVSEFDVDVKTVHTDELHVNNDLYVTDIYYGEGTDAALKGKEMISSNGEALFTKINGVALPNPPEFTDTTYVFAEGTTDTAFQVTPEGASAQSVKVHNVATSKVLSNTDNLNSIVTPGFYTAMGSNSITNKPTGVNNFGLIVIHNAGGSFYTQKLYDGTNEWIRNCIGGTWGAWTKGGSAGDYLPLTGGTLTGGLNINDNLAIRQEYGIIGVRGVNADKTVTKPSDGIISFISSYVPTGGKGVALRVKDVSKTGSGPIIDSGDTVGKVDVLGGEINIEHVDKIMLQAIPRVPLGESGSRQTDWRTQSRIILNSDTAGYPSLNLKSGEQEIKMSWRSIGFDAGSGGFNFDSDNGGFHVQTGGAIFLNTEDSGIEMNSLYDIDLTTDRNFKVYADEGIELKSGNEVVLGGYDGNYIRTTNTKTNRSGTYTNHTFFKVGNVDSGDYGIELFEKRNGTAPIFDVKIRDGQDGNVKVAGGNVYIGGNNINLGFSDHNTNAAIRGDLTIYDRAMPLAQGKVTGLTAGTTKLFKDGIAISNPATPNDLGWIRVLGTGESDTVMEIATGDDAGAGESIVFRGYNTSNAIGYQVDVPKATGTIALQNGSYPNMTVGSAGSADHADSASFASIAEEVESENTVTIKSYNASVKIEPETYFTVNAGNVEFNINNSVDINSEGETNVYAEGDTYLYGHYSYYHPTQPGERQSGGSMINLCDNIVIDAHDGVEITSGYYDKDDEDYSNECSFKVYATDIELYDPYNYNKVAGMRNLAQSFQRFSSPSDFAAMKTRGCNQISDFGSNFVSGLSSDGVMLVMGWGGSSSSYGHVLAANDDGPEFFHSQIGGGGPKWAQVYDTLSVPCVKSEQGRGPGKVNSYYIKYPDGTLIQGVTKCVTRTGGETVNFPIAFINNYYSISSNLIRVNMNNRSNLMDPSYMTVKQNGYVEFEFSGYKTDIYEEMGYGAEGRLELSLVAIGRWK